MLRELLLKNKAGETVGIPSYCTSNTLVIEALMQHALETDYPLLFEATANQVNQFGGYTGMLPAGFRDQVYAIADRIGIDRGRIILGGDHLGPLTWSDLPEAEAMTNARELVRLFAEAGYSKIHLDTSMRLADDNPDQPLSDETIARRGVELYRVAMDAYELLKQDHPDAVRPSFIIGSEVPIPGGEQEAEDSLQVTTPDALIKTLNVYKDTFAAQGVADGFEDVIAVVVQPGVEFGSDSVHVYNPAKAADLTRTMRQIPSIVMEGHSSDYQPVEALTQMVEDGVGILKVGPGLTFALREALFALSAIEAILIPQDQRANVPAKLEAAMLADPKNWIKHYHGNEQKLQVERAYSLSDRARYYIGADEVTQAIDRLIENLNGADIPLGLLHQYLPAECEALIASGEPVDVQRLITEHISIQARIYEGACFSQYKAE